MPDVANDLAYCGSNKQKQKKSWGCSGRAEKNKWGQTKIYDPALSPRMSGDATDRMLGFPLYPLIPLCGKPRVFSRRQWVPRKQFSPLLASIEQKKKKEHTKRKEGSVSHSGGRE
ncbi:hypothetical protein CEXT_755531 [Caerostris extrusa]|uniref:Uncharacterized protein n=1 Tax=Caerostris extrusa TaxID=172846 RepID=A0AAV4P0Z6_CAEEX|nr:hypothetical protein CEXT_755531 [Caerostris extrusa]